jgi:hypothetical protein
MAKQLKTHYNQIASAFIPGNQYKKMAKEQKLDGLIGLYLFMKKRIVDCF